MTITKDKIYHFLVNVVLSMSAFISYPLAVGLCVGASFGKEFGDAMATRPNWNWRDSLKDLVADMLGMGLGLLCVYLIRRTI